MYAVVLLTLVLAITTDALLDQNADSLVPVVYSVENPTKPYLARGFAFVQILSSVFDDYSVNLRVQVLIRIGAFSFVSLWLVSRVSHLFPKERFAIQCVGLLVVCAFVLDYPVVGESLIHGSNGAMLAALLLIGWALFSSSASNPVAKPNIRRGIDALVAVVFAVLAMWTWVPSVLWSPLFVGLAVATDSRWSGLSLVDFIRFLVTRTWIPIASMGAAFFLYRNEIPSLPESGQDYSVRRAARGLLYAATIWEPENRFIFRWVLIAVVLSVFALVVALMTRRWAKSLCVRLVVSGLGLSATLSAIFIAGFKHIEDNRFHPRYFGASLLMGALCTSSIAAGVVFRWLAALPRAESLSRRSERFFASKRLAAPIEIACMALVLTLAATFATSSIGFGLESSKAHEVEIAGNPLRADALRQIDDNYANPVRFVMGNHWDVWPTIFVAGEEQNKRLVALSHFDVGSGRIAALLDSGNVDGVCLDARVEQCLQIAASVFASMNLRNEVQLEPVLSMNLDGRIVNLVRIIGSGG